MKTEWKAFLQDAGADFMDDKVFHFGNPERERRMVTTGNVFTDLSYTGLIGAYGDDATDFLQGQFTNDLKQVSPTQSQLSAFCNSKGRMLAMFRIFQRDGTYYLRLSRQTLEETLKKLRMYILRSKVTLEDASESFVHIGFSGPGAENQLKDAVGKIPEGIDATVQIGGLTIIRIPGLNPRFEIIGELEPAKKLWSRLDVHAAPVGAAAWGLLDILAGIPNIYANTVEEFVPQMVNLQALNGISFTKGCYTGQEIVARTHYLGKLKRRMYLAHIDSNEVPQPGDSVVAENTEGDQSAGKIVDSNASPGGGYDVLAVIVISSAQAGKVHLHNQEGPLLQMRELPYSIENA
jgi:folate-binding protein YgfZ